MDMQAEAARRQSTALRAERPTTARPGHTLVHDRVIHKVVAEACAEEFGLERKHVTVTVATARAGLAISLATPLPIPRLDDDEAVQAAQPLVQSVGAAQARLRERIGHITGREVNRVNVTITGAISREVRRVS